MDNSWTTAPHTSKPHNKYYMFWWMSENWVTVKYQETDPSIAESCSNHHNVISSHLGPEVGTSGTRDLLLDCLSSPAAFLPGTLESNHHPDNKWIVSCGGSASAGVHFVDVFWSPFHLATTSSVLNHSNSFFGWISLARQNEVVR